MWDCTGEFSEGLQSEGTGMARLQGCFLLLEVGTLRTEWMSLNIFELLCECQAKKQCGRQNALYDVNPLDQVDSDIIFTSKSMRRFLYGCLFGGIAVYAGLENYKKVIPASGLPHEDHSIVKSYIHHHKLQKLLKQSIMNGYMQLSKSFLDYGLRERLEGFSFYGTYFRTEEVARDNISHAYCIFSPKEQLCGHPNIQHGGATATIADQNSGLLAMINSYEIVATSELAVKYLKPVKKGQIYAWHGQVDRRDGRKIYIKSTIVQLQTGILCAQATALMMTVNWQHKMADVFHLLFKKGDKVQEVS